MHVQVGRYDHTMWSLTTVDAAPRENSWRMNDLLKITSLGTMQGFFNSSLVSTYGRQTDSTCVYMLC